jgi:CBS domain-containing protein
VRRDADQGRPLGPAVERGSGERLTAPTAAEVAEFLRHHPPFDALDDADVQRVAAAAEVEVHRAGTTVFSQGAEPVGYLRVVRSGAVELVLDGRVLDLLGVGELFGQASMLSGLPTGFTARAEEDTVCYRIPADVARGLLGRPEALQFVTRSLLDRGRLARRADDRAGDRAAPSHQPVAALMRGPLIVCPPQTSIRDAALRMTDTGASCVVVDLGGSLGIVTDRDLRTRVVGGGLSHDGPISAAMTAPAYTVAADRLGSEVWLDMLDRGIRHFPVLSATGEVLGVVEDADLVAAETRTSFYLRAAIARASTTDELVEAARDLRPTIVALHRARTAPLHLAGIHSVVVDALIRRLIDLTVAEVGAAPTPFAWLALGSLARREALPGSDVDSAVAWRGEDEDHPTILDYALKVSRSVDEGLAACGLRVDTKGTTAANPLLVRSLASWRRAAQSWLEDPTQEQALILVSVVVDSRPVWGIHTGVSLAEGFRDARRHPALLRQLARFSLSFRPPTGFRRGLVVEHSGEHRGQLDLKHGGLVPIVDLARWAGMAAGVTSASTPERLRAAAAAGTLSAADAGTLADAFELVMGLRVQHHVEQIEAGSEPDDHIDPATLSPLTRSYLKEAFRAVASVQKGISSELSLRVR